MSDNKADKTMEDALKAIEDGTVYSDKKEKSKEDLFLMNMILSAMIERNTDELIERGFVQKKTLKVGKQYREQVRKYLDHHFDASEDKELQEFVNKSSTEIEEFIYKQME